MKQLKWVLISLMVILGAWNGTTMVPGLPLLRRKRNYKFLTREAKKQRWALKPTKVQRRKSWNGWVTQEISLLKGGQLSRKDNMQCMIQEKSTLQSQSKSWTTRTTFPGSTTMTLPKSYTSLTRALLRPTSGTSTGKVTRALQFCKPLTSTLVLTTPSDFTLCLLET